jgi:hypothetical protein
MSCEQVEELLSAYLDNMLALRERHSVAAHLQRCQHCKAILDDYRRFDALLAQMPPVSPGPAIRYKLFSSLAYQELLDTLDMDEQSEVHEKLRLVDRRIYSNSSTLPKLIALPGRRSFCTLTQRHTHLCSSISTRSRQNDQWIQRAIQIAIAAMLLLALGTGGLMSWRLSHSQSQQKATTADILPTPAGLSQTPLAAGRRFVFLRNGALWSGSTAASAKEMQLTPGGVTVAANWVIRPALPGHSAGDMLAYVDVQRGFIHIIRSDGQNDSVVPQQLLKTGIAPTSVWGTAEGQSILDSLSWSPDGTHLAFVADPQGIGSTSLYIYSLTSNTVQATTLLQAGSVSQPIWSPDGVRLALALTHGTTTEIIDYNTQSHGTLGIVAISTPDRLLTLDWSPDVAAPAITWSAGMPGHTHSIGVDILAEAQVHMLAEGDFAQASYSRNGDNGAGSWLLINTQPGQMSVHSVDLNAQVRLLVMGKQVSVAQWSPNGTAIDYLEAQGYGMGNLHVVSLTSGIDTLIATGVVATPQPAWSSDSRMLAYSTSQYTFSAALQAPGGVQTQRLASMATTLIWAVSPSTQLMVGTQDGSLYLVDGIQHTVIKLDTSSIRAPVEWTQIP